MKYLSFFQYSNFSKYFLNFKIYKKNFFWIKFFFFGSIFLSGFNYLNLIFRMKILNFKVWFLNRFFFNFLNKFLLTFLHSNYFFQLPTHLYANLACPPSPPLAIKYRLNGFEHLAINVFFSRSTTSIPSGTSKYCNF